MKVRSHSNSGSRETALSTPAERSKNMKSSFVNALLTGASHPTIERNRRIGVEVLKLQREADTLNTYARAAARTYEETGRESCIGAQARFETAALAKVERIHQLNQSRGM